MVKTKNFRLSLSSKYAAYDSKKSRFIKEKEAKGSLSTLGIKTPLSKNSIVKHFVLIIWHIKWIK